MESEISVGTPLILINFKAYDQSVGNKGLELAKICEKVAKEHGVEIAVAPQCFDLKEICSKVEIPVFSQHIDPIEDPGSHTGHVVAKNLKTTGIVGTLINHSERQIPLKDIEKCVKVAKSSGLISVCCVPDTETGKEVARFEPDFIAFEVPELIGSGKAISQEQPDSVKEFVEETSKISSKVIPLCGAGISTGEDVKASMELGTKGVLVASAVVKVENPEQVLKNFAESLK